MRRGNMKTIELGKIAGLRLTAHWTAFVGFVLVWAILSMVAIGLFYLSPLTGILSALAATLLHYFSEFFHQWGHARAALRVGYPMIGVRYCGGYWVCRFIPKMSRHYRGQFISSERWVGLLRVSFSLSLLEF
jgi:hypothetical protein